MITIQKEDWHPVTELPDSPRSVLIVAKGAWFDARYYRMGYYSGDLGKWILESSDLFRKYKETPLLWADLPEPPEV